MYRLLYEELLCRLHCIIYEFLTGISYVVLNDLYNNVGLLTSDPTTLLLPKSIAVVEENVSSIFIRENFKSYGYLLMEGGL